MDCEFSETQFVVCAMHELMNKLLPSGGWTMPFIPTQVEEKKVGYDCRLKGPVKTLFIQFKVSKKFTRKHAKHWNDFKKEYYQFKIWPDSKTHQHNDLVDLANKSAKNRVFYCAPAFISNIEFENYYTKGEVLQNSIFVDCKTLWKISGDDKHCVCFLPDPKVNPIMHSEPVEITRMDCKEVVQDIMQAESYRNLEECVYELSQQFAEGLKEECSNYSLQGKLEAISKYLFMKKNIYLVLV